MFDKVAIWDPQNLGDHILCTPIYRFLKQILKVKTLDILFDPKQHGHKSTLHFLEHNPFIDNMIITNEWDLNKSLLDRYRYDRILRSHYGNWKDFPETHIKDILCNNIEKDLGNIEIKDRQIQVNLTKSDEDFGKKYSGCVSFVPFADFMGWGRNWNISKWVELGEKFLSLGKRVIVLHSEKHTVFDKFTNLTGIADIRQAVSVIKNSSLHVCVSTFSEIVSDLFLIPTVVLSGSTDPSIVGYKNNSYMTKRIYCWPCFSGRLKSVVCSKSNIPCNEFTVEEVFEKCIQITENV